MTLLFKAGKYTGNGSDPQTISGIGFQPKAVIIMATVGTGDASCAQWKTDGMTTGATGVTRSLGSAVELATGQIDSFTSDGFLVRDQKNINTTTYYYMAFGGSSCVTGSYTGDANDNRAITGVGFQPDFVWIKARSQPYEHNLLDAVRGPTKLLFSSLTNAESTTVNFNSFDSDGFNVDAEGGGSAFNQNGTTYVAWNWKANGAGSSNTAGTISSTVSANTAAGFSIVTYTAAGANSTVGHGLGVAPSMIIIKRRDSTGGWGTYHSAVGNTKYLILNGTDAATTDSTYWNNTSPTSTVFSLGSIWPNTATYVAYCFAPVAGYSAFGSYTGNGSSDGPFIYTGFRPKWILIKPSSLADVWQIEDAARSQFNVVNDQLFPNSSAAEQVDSATRNTDFLSNGFKIRGTNGGINQSSDTYIYAAFAEVPTKFSLAR